MRIESWTYAWMVFVGKMSMTIPNFINLDYDEANRKAFVSVEDKEIKKQREMWGKIFTQLKDYC